MERINALPKPRSFGSLFVESFLHGLYGNVFAGYMMGVDADKKQQAILMEMEGLAGAVESADALHLLLPKVAEKYAARLTPTGRIKVDFDESWYGRGTYDWCCLYNTGEELEDCTVVLDIKGIGGQTRKNIHFVPKWAGNSWVYARYDLGSELNGRRVGIRSVPNVEAVEATVLSSKFSTKVNYTYSGAEMDKDISQWCRDLKLRMRYQPFNKGIFSDTQRGMLISLSDYPELGPCRIEAAFKRGVQSKSWSYELESWKKDEEKTFSTPVGGLSYDPESVEVILSFPRTSFRARWELKVNK